MPNTLVPSFFTELGIMKRRIYTWKDLVRLGHPYSRQYTGRLERAGRFPQRMKHGNRVFWWADDYDEWLQRTFQPVPVLAE